MGVIGRNHERPRQCAIECLRLLAERNTQPLHDMAQYRRMRTLLCSASCLLIVEHRENACSLARNVTLGKHCLQTGKGHGEVVYARRLEKFLTHPGKSGFLGRIETEFIVSDILRRKIFPCLLRQMCRHYRAYHAAMVPV